ncbi:MAG: prepilin-type N-terminal cleavage/methylation domain-containing protein [Phycisphaerae bacterium]|nr:prepilin-type N-terminal cleavage/methylation domain-containing protein [Phycisphaerae bacterium]
MAAEALAHLAVHALDRRKPRPPGGHARGHRRAFTFVEVLIATALLAMLLAAIALAVQAAIQGYEENERVAAMTQAARSVLARMTREVRTADEVNTTSTSISILPPEDGSGLTLIRYTWDNGVLTYEQTASGVTTSEVLLGGEGMVSAPSFTVSRQTGIADALVYTKTVTATITVATGGRTFAATASADVRRNQQY